MRLRLLVIALAAAVFLMVGVDLWPWFRRDVPHVRKVSWPPAPGQVINFVAQTNMGAAAQVVLAAGASIAARTVSWEEFQREFTNHSDDAIWYCGTKDGYDWFRLQPGPLSRTSAQQTYRVASTNAPLTKRYPLSTTSSNWVSSAEAAGLTH
jgi:hypothetical protein